MNGNNLNGNGNNLNENENNEMNRMLEYNQNEKTAIGEIKSQLFHFCRYQEQVEEIKFGTGIHLHEMLSSVSNCRKVLRKFPDIPATLQSVYAIVKGYCSIQGEDRIQKSMKLFYSKVLLDILVQLNMAPEPLQLARFNRVGGTRRNRRTVRNHNRTRNY